MGLFFCPRFRRSRKLSASPDVLHPYHLSRLEMPSISGEYPESTIRGTSSSVEEPTTHGHQRGSSGGLSDKLRRRFSREAKGLQPIPKASDKKTHASIFALSTKSVKAGPDPVASDYIGSSLMSEKGYDSDAQFITTPKQVNPATEDPPHKLGLWKTLSPLEQSYEDIEREISNIRSLGSITESYGTVQSLGNKEMERSQSSWRAQNHGNVPPQTSQNLSVPRNAYHESPGVMDGSPCRSLNGNIPSDATGEPRSVGHGAYYPRLRAGIQNVSMPINTSKGDGQYFATTNPEYAMGLSDCGRYISQPYPSSANSLIGPTSQISVTKRRQRLPSALKSDAQSVHLGDMNISKALASPSLSPRVLSQNESLDENRSSHKGGTRSTLNQLTTSRPVCDATETSSNPTPIKKGSSSYSRNISFSSTELPRFHFETSDVYQPLDKPARDLTRRDASSSPQGIIASRLNEPIVLDSGGANPANAQRGKFIEHLDSDRSVSSLVPNSCYNLGENIVSPRQVSVGWMSGGRRLGYGYTLVPADNETEQPSHGNFVTPMAHKMKKTLSEKKTEACDWTNQQCTERPSQTSLKTGESAFDISKIIHRLSPRNRHTSLEAASDTASGDSAPSSALRARLAHHKKDKNYQVPTVDEKPPWSHFCGVGQEQTLNEQRGPQMNDQLVRRETGLRHVRSIWAKGQTMAARGVEVKYLAKVKASAAQDSMRNGKRGLKFKIRDLKKRPHGLELTQEEDRDSNSVTRGIDEDEPSCSERPSSDVLTEDWVDAYQDCVEMHLDPD